MADLWAFPRTAAWEGSIAGELKVLRVHDREMRLRWCPADQFLMGSPRAEVGREPWENQAPVTLARGFWLQESPVIQGLWKGVMGTAPSEFEDLLGNVWEWCADSYLPALPGGVDP